MFEWIADMITFNLLNLERESGYGEALHFFIYDSIKILVLIFAVVSLIAFIRTFLPGEDIKKFVSKARFGLGNLAAAVFGAVTPFCSCSSIPIFIGFLKARIPMGIAFSFLITSPLVNEVAFVIMGGLFGWKLAIMYAFSGIALGVVAGMLLGSLKMESSIILNENGQDKKQIVLPRTLKKKFTYSFKQGLKTLKKLYPYILGGMALGAFIHGFVPQEFFMNYIGKYSVLSVPIAAIVGIPIYAGCSTVVPIIFGITANGVPLGTSLAFMMSIAGLSLPEAIILKRVMKLKLLAIFFGIVGVGIILIGYLFNLVGVV
ncbi:permease [Patescibacteria group bacterium]